MRTVFSKPSPKRSRWTRWRGTVSVLSGRLWQVAKSAILAVACFAASEGTALAQRTYDTPTETSSSGPYTPAYALLIFGVALGLLVVLKSSNRQDREGPAKYVEKNILKED
jgi:H+/Cl- antiporter ClcA